ncbi:MAG: tail fiber protein [Anaerolineae bacterium]|jgi:microcystin-dependent protein|nr:tail fiber protein [Anaerolineae bacterium]
MGNPYVGEIRMFGGNFAPLGWMLCQGQLLPISEYEVLFQLIGTTYGGDGQETFALPNLSSRVPVHQGQAPGLGSYVLGETGGVETVTLTPSTLPTHNHIVMIANQAATDTTPANTLVPAASVANIYDVGPDTTLSPSTIQPAGGSQPHNNIQPILAINFIISLYGIFPSPS